MYDIWNRLEKKGWFIGKIVPRWRRSAIKYSYWQCELIHDDGKSDASTPSRSIRKKGVEFNDADFRLGIWPGTCSASTFENCSTREAFLLRASRVYQSIWYSCLIHVFFGLKYDQNYQFIHFQNMSYLLKKTREVKERWIVKVHSCSPLNSWVIPFSKMTRSSETRGELSGDGDHHVSPHLKWRIFPASFLDSILPLKSSSLVYWDDQKLNQQQRRIERRSCTSDEWTG